MKHILCLLLTLALLTGAALAGDVFPFSMVDYHGCASSLLPRLGYEVAWEDVSAEVEAKCLQLSYTNLVNPHGVYLLGEPVSSIDILYDFTITSSQDDLEGSVNEFTQLVKSAVLCAWVAENADVPELQQLMNESLASVEDEMVALVAPLLHMDGDFTGHAVQNGTLFGYPCEFTIDLNMDTFECMLTVTVSPMGDVRL